MQKLCIKCGKIKHLQEFYKHKQMSDGHLNKCKECCKQDSVKNRKEKIEYYREYDRQRANKTERIKAREEYRHTEAGKKAVYNATKNYRVKNPERRLLYAHCEKFLKNPGVCSECKSNILVEAHHDDYNKPFEVRWLCRKCHRKWHKNNEPIKLKKS